MFLKNSWNYVYQDRRDSTHCFAISIYKNFGWRSKIKVNPKCFRCYNKCATWGVKQCSLGNQAKRTAHFGDMSLLQDRVLTSSMRSFVISGTRHLKPVLRSLLPSKQRFLSNRSSCINNSSKGGTCNELRHRVQYHSILSYGIWHTENRSCTKQGCCREPLSWLLGRTRQLLN